MGLVTSMGAITLQRLDAGDLSEPAQQLATDQRIAELSRRKSDDQLGAQIKPGERGDPATLSSESPLASYPISCSASVR